MMMMTEVHLHTDLMSRLSGATLEKLSCLEKIAAEQAPQCENAGQLKELGEQLLESYIEVLKKPGAFISKAKCTMAIAS